MCGLTGNVDELINLERRLVDVQVLVQTEALAPLRDNGELRARRASHEQQDVRVPRLPVKTKRGVVSEAGVSCHALGHVSLAVTLRMLIRKRRALRR